jgi:glycerophosphoryl diester phosphodiesterase
MVLKILANALKALLVAVVSMVLVLVIIGGGWGAKHIVEAHHLYTGKFTLVAHRGVTDSAPENTMASAARARELGFTFIELDLKQSKDQRFYLFHDRDSQRLFGTDVRLSNYTLPELQEIPLLHQGIPTDHRVPSMNDFTNQFSDKLTFYLDVKRHGNYHYGALAEQLTIFLAGNGLTDRSMVGSDFLFTAYLEYRYPELHTVFTGPGNWTIVFYRWIPKKFRPDFIISYAEEVTDWHLEWLKRNDLVNRRMLYGVNGNNYNRVRRWGIPYLVVDYHPVMEADLIRNW